MAPQTVPDAIGLNLALAIVATSAAPLLLLDNDLVIIAASASFRYESEHELPASVNLSSGILTRIGAATVCGGRIPPREAGQSEQHESACLWWPRR